MKNLLNIFAIVIALLAFSSCTKDYTCSCTFTGGSTIDSALLDVSQSDAEDACDQADADARAVDPDASCTLTEN